MIEKYPIKSERIRRVPKGFGWVDHRVVQNLIKDFLSLGNSAKSFLEELEATELAPRMHLRKILRLTAIYDKELIANALQDAVELKTYRYKYVEYLLNSRAKNSSMNNGLLHVPRAQDLLEIRTENPGMNQYNK